MHLFIAAIVLACIPGTYLVVMTLLDKSEDTMPVNEISDMEDKLKKYTKGETIEYPEDNKSDDAIDITEDMSNISKQYFTPSRQTHNPPPKPLKRPTKSNIKRSAPNCKNFEPIEKTKRKTCYNCHNYLRDRTR